jgi:hypothetical protein
VSNETDELYASWRYQNSLCRYPFTDESTMLATTGETMPDDVFVDASLIFVQASPVSLRRIDVAGGKLVATFQNEIETELATATFTVDGLQDTAPLVAKNGYTKVGLIVCNPAGLAEFARKSPATLAFKHVVAKLNPRCMHNYQSQAVTSVAPETAVGQTGNVYLIGENGIVLTRVTTRVLPQLDPIFAVTPSSQTQNVNWIRVDIVGDPLKNANACNTVEMPPYNVGLFAQTVVGATPAFNGNIQLLADRRFGNSALRIQVGDDPSELVISIVGGKA